MAELQYLHNQLFRFSAVSEPDYLGLRKRRMRPSRAKYATATHYLTRFNEPMCVPRRAERLRYLAHATRKQIT